MRLKESFCERVQRICKDTAFNAIESYEDLEEISVVRVQATADPGL